MTHWTFYALTAVVGAAITALLMPLVILAGRSWGLLDEPDARKVHLRPVPRVGGTAIAVGTLASAIAFMVVAHARDGLVSPELLQQLIAVGAAAAFIFIVGFIDDARGVTPRFKAMALVAASLTVCGSGATLDTIYLGGAPYLELGLAAWPLTVLWIVGMAIAINFIDGLDGLAGGLVLIAAAALAGFAIQSGQPAVAVVPLALAGSLAGFLIFNSHPARVFMGDSGSFFIGFVIASAAVVANPVIGTMEGLLIPGLALSVPIVDTALTLFRRRYQQRRSIFAAERGHIHHALLDQGMTQRQAVFTLYGVSLLAVGIGWLAWAANGLPAFGALSLIVPLLWGAFRLAGSVRTAEMLDAVRRKRAIDRAAHRFEDAFHQLQLEFRNATDFPRWWQSVCNAAERFEFAKLEMPLEARDGSVSTLTWTPEEPVDDDITRLHAAVPIPQRRGHEPLTAKVEVVATRSVESAGNRLALFTRLMSDHSVAHLPAPGSPGRSRRHPNGRPLTKREQLAQIAGFDKIALAATAGGIPRPLMEKGKHPNPDGLQTAGPFAGKRVALIHDFLYVYAGAEKVLEQFIELFPEADIFALFDFLPDDQRGFLKGKEVKTSFIQKMPFAKKKHRGYLPLMPLAIEQLDVSGYDLVLSSSYIAAKGVITGPNQTHVCYCHSPARYAWDLQHQYLDQKRIGFGPKGMMARAILHYIRNWDARSALGVDLFIANSNFVAQRIQKLYRRDSIVIHPPVDTDFFTPHDPPGITPGTDDSPGLVASATSELPQKADFYVTASRLVPYKRIDLVVEAFNRMPDKQLIVVGTGPEYHRIAALAGPNISLVGYQPDESLRRYLRLAKAFVFAAEEDFGIIPVEAMACGTPVIAYGHGGARETITPGKTGVFFDRQTPDAVIDAVYTFENTLAKQFAANAAASSGATSGGPASTSGAGATSGAGGGWAFEYHRFTKARFRREIAEQLLATLNLNATPGSQNPRSPTPGSQNPGSPTPGSPTPGSATPQAQRPAPSPPAKPAQSEMPQAPSPS